MDRFSFKRILVCLLATALLLVGAALAESDSYITLSPNELTTQEALSITVQAPNAQSYTVTIRDGAGAEVYNETQNGDSFFDEGITFDHAGEYTVYANIERNGDSPLSDWKSFTVTQAVPAVNAWVVNSAGQVVPGEFLTVHVDPVDGAAYYLAQVFSDETCENLVTYYDYCWDREDPAAACRSTAAGDIYVPSARLTGNMPYYVQVEAFDADEQNLGVSAALPFTVGTPGSGFDFRVSAADIFVGDAVWASAYYEGAQRVDILLDGAPWYWNNGSAACVKTIHNELRDVRMQAVATMSDGSVVLSDEITIRVDSHGVSGTISVENKDFVIVDGSGLTFTYAAEPNEACADQTTPVYAWLTDVTTEDQQIWETELTLDGTSFTVPYSVTDEESGETKVLFETGHVYRVEVSYAFTGYEYVTVSDVFSVQSEAGDSRVRIQVAGESERVSVDRNSDVLVSISAPGATAVRFFGGDDFWNLNDWGEWQEWSQSGDEWNIRFDWSYWTDRNIYAEACFDEDPWTENAQWVRSNTVFVEQTVYGESDAIGMTLESDHVTRGSYLSAALNYPENITNSWIDVYSFAEDREIWNWGLADTHYETLNVPTAHLEAGAYILHITGNREGYSDRVTSLPFVVTEDATGEAPEGIILSKTTVQTHEPLALNVWTQNATYYNVIIRDGEGNEVFAQDYGCDNGNVFIINELTFDHGGTYTVEARVERDSLSTQVYNKSFTVTSEGELADPEVTVAEPVLAGQNLTVTVSSVEGAEWYDISLGTPMGERWDIYNESFAFEEGETEKTFTLNTDEYGIWDGMYVRVQVFAHALGKDSGLTERFFMTGMDVGDREVSLAVNGQSSEVTVTANEPVNIVVNAPDAEFVDIFNGWENWDGFDRHDGQNGWVTTRTFDEDTTELYVRAYYGHDDENDREIYAYSNKVTVHTSSSGGVDDGVEGDLLSVFNPNADVYRGKDLSFRIADGLKHVDHIRLEIWGDLNGEWRQWMSNVVYAGGDMTLPTDTLLPGEYQLQVAVNARPGYKNAYADAPFTVLAGEETFPERTIAVSKIGVVTGEHFAVMVSAPDASRIRIYDRWTDNVEEFVHEQWGGTASFETELFDGQRNYRAAALVNDEWVWLDGDVTVYCDTNGQLADPGVKLQSTVLRPGDDLVINFNGTVENADSYSFWIQRQDWDGDQWIYSRDVYETGEITVPGELFAVGARYTVWFDSNSHAGYRNGQRGMDFRVLDYDAESAGAVLTVDGATEGSVFTQQDYELVLNVPEGATGVIMYYPGWEDYRMLDAEGGETEIPFGDSQSRGGEYTYIAKYTTDPIGDETDWENDLNWTWSNAVTVTVSSVGALPAPQVSLSRDEESGDVIKGTVLKATIDNMADYQGYNGLHFEAEIYDPSNDTWPGDGRKSWTERDGAIYLPTADLWLGNYALYVYYWAEGYDDATTFITFVANENSENVVLDVENTQLLTNENLVFSAWADEAQDVRVRVYRDMEDEDGNTWREYYNGGEEGESRPGSFFESFWSYSQPGDYVLEATYTFEDGSEQTRTAPFTVSAPNGQFGEVTLTANPMFNIDEGLTFTIEGPDEVEWYGLWIHDLTDGDTHVYGRDYETDGTYTIQRNEFTEGPQWNHAYKIHVDAMGYGYEGVAAEALVHATPDAGEITGQLTLAVNGESEYVSVPSCVDYTLDIRMDGIENYNLEYFEADGWRWIDRPDQISADGQISIITGGWGGRNTSARQVRAWLEPEEGEQPEYIYSNIVVVEVYADLQPDAPEFTISSDTLARGDILTVSFEGVEDIDRYNIDIYGDEWGHGLWSVAPGTYQISTISMAPGEYSIEIQPVITEGMNWADCEETRKTFTVTEGADPAGIYVWLNGQALNAEGGNEFTFGPSDGVNMEVYAPGAEHIMVWYNTDDNTDKWEWWGGDGEYIRANHSRRNDETMRLTVSTDYGEGWTEPAYATVIDVTADDDRRLPQPWINFETRILREGEDLHAWLDYMDISGWYSLRLDGPRGNQWSAIVENGTGFTVPGAYLQEPGTYLLNITGAVEGYMDGCNSYEITVLDSAQEPTITLTVDGDPNAETMPIWQDYRVTAGIGDENVTGIALWNGDEWEYETGNYIERSWNWGHEHTRRYVAKATRSDIGDGNGDWWNLDSTEWTDISNVIDLTFTADGNLPAPVVALDIATVARGGVITATVTNMDGLAGAQMHAAAHIDEEWWSDLWYDADSQGVITVPTAYLEPGEYQLRVDAWGIPGKFGSSADVSFTVTEGPADGIHWTLSDTSQLLSTDPVRFNVYAPGAESMDVELIECGIGEDGGDQPIDGRHFDGDFACESSWISSDHANEYYLRATVHYPHGGMEVSESAHFTVTAPYGDLPAVEAIIPEYVRADEDLTFTLNGNQAIEWVDFAFYDENERDENGNHRWVGGGRFGLGENTIHRYEMNDFPWHHAYSADVTAFARGYNASYTNVRFYTAQYEPNSEMTLLVNGGTGDRWTSVNSTVDVEIIMNMDGINADEFNHFEIYNGESWQRLDRGLGNGHVRTTNWGWNFGSSGSMTIQAVAVFHDANNEEYDIYSNLVTIYADEVGRVDAPTIAIDRTTVDRGESLTVTVGGVENANWYQLHYGNESWGHGIMLHAPGEFALPTADLEPGEYSIMVMAEGREGWANSDWSEELTFTVTQERGFNNEVYVWVDGTELTNGNVNVFPHDVYDTFSIVLWAPGAEKVRIEYADDESFENSWDMVNIEGELWSTQEWRDNEQHMCLRFSAMYGGEWVVQPATAVIDIHGENRLDEPNAFLYYPVLAAGEDLTVHIDGVENGQYYELRINDDTLSAMDRNGNIFNAIAHDDEWITVPADYFTPGHDYGIGVSAYADGWVSHHIWRGLSVLPVGTQQTVELTIDGNADEERGIAINFGYNIAVEAPEQVTGLAIYNGDEWRYYAGNTFAEEWSRGDARNVTFIAKGTRDAIDPDSEWWNDDVTWTDYSNRLNVNFWVEGELAPLQAHLVSDTVMKGELARVVVDNPEDYDGYGWIGGNFYDPETDTWFEGWGDGYRTEYAFPTIQLTPGKTYILEVGIDGVPGKYGTRTQLEVAVTEPEGVIIGLDKNEIVTQERAKLSVYAPGAESISVIMYKDGNEEARCFEDEYDGEYYERWDLGDGRPGVYTIAVTALYEDGSENTASVDLTVTAPNGPLDEPWIDILTPFVPADGELRFRVGFDERAESVNLFVTETEWHLWDDEVVNGGEYALNASELGLEPGQFYDVGIGLSAWGYEDSNRFSEFRVVSSADDTITFTASAAETMVNGEPVTIHVGKNGATAVRLYSADYNDNAVAGSGSDFECGFPWSGEFTFYAMVTYDPIDAEALANDYDYMRSLNWIVNPNSITVTVNTNGRVGDFSVTTPDSVNRGEYITFTISESENAQYYDLHIREFNDEGEVIAEDWAYERFEAPGTYTYSTANLPDGREYAIKITAAAEGYDWNEAWSELFSVNTPDLPVIFDVEKNEALIKEDVNFSVYAPGAATVVLSTPENDWTWDAGDLNEDGFMNGSFTVKGETGTMYVMAKAIFADGTEEYGNITPRLTLTSNGKAETATVLRMPGAIYTGESLSYFLNEVGNMREYHVSVDDLSTGENMIYTEGVMPGENSIDTSAWPAGDYIMTVITIGGVGYEDSSTTVTFRILESGAALTTLKLPMYLTTIEEEAFTGTTAERIMIATACQSIGSRAFADCPNLLFVEIPNSVTDIAGDAFAGTHVTIVCNSGSYAEDYADENNIACKTN
ncbi:MAG: leucine-rich repeat domain-containing protein [Clostridia bacterium]|nr:leucine-rich repeat domain-containing protein [Clostridia bacterium]